jgi:GTP-binding protein EngB required for normal cell division
MAAQENIPRLSSYVKFRVLIVGRANAGKTSILKRVGDTLKSSVTYSVDPSGTRKRVCSLSSGTYRSHRLARLNSNLRRRLGTLIFVGDG